MYVAGFVSYAHPLSMHKKKAISRVSHISERQQTCKGMRKKIRGQGQNTNKHNAQVHLPLTPRQSIGYPRPGLKNAGHEDDFDSSHGFPRLASVLVGWVRGGGGKRPRSWVVCDSMLRS